MKNEFLEYYEKYQISPVRQDITNMQLHNKRREKLYRQCGIPVIAFQNAEILEIGPGGGYNTLAFFHWGSKHVDLVEANNKGIQEMKELFAKQEVPSEKYKIIPCRIEDYQTEKKYDLVIAEGFIHCLENHGEIIRKLQMLAAEHGVVVITCMDHTGLFIELMKRLLGYALTRDVLQYEDKVRELTALFAPQLSKLRGVSRKAEDWVKDMVLNPIAHNQVELSMAQAIGYFEQDFDILGASPNIFTDYSWYKDIWYNYQEDYKKQFAQKRLSLLMAGMPQQELALGRAGKLTSYFAKIRELAAAYEKELDVCCIKEILKCMKEMEPLLEPFDREFIGVFSEIQDALNCILETGSVDMQDYPHFFAAFGRSQQYMAFQKK